MQLLVTLSFCLGASAIAPALVYGLFWRRYTRTGLLCTLIGGTLTVLILMTGTNLVSRGPHLGLPRGRLQLVPVHHHRPRVHSPGLRLRMARTVISGAPQGAGTAQTVRGGGGVDPGGGGTENAARVNALRGARRWTSCGSAAWASSRNPPAA